MKKLFYNYKTIGAASILCLSAMATSCSQELEEGKVQTDNNPAALSVVKLNFATDALTRGTMFDDIAQMPDNATFGVYGYAHKDGETTPNDPNFINNGSAKKDGVVRVKGKVATYKTNMPKVQLAAVYPQLSDGSKFKRTSANTYTLTYSLQEDMAQQKDLMIGQAEEFDINDQNSTAENINSGKTINMHHALTALNFVIGDRIPTGYTIEGISLQGLYTNGTCHVDLSKSTDAERFTWDLTNAKKGEVHIKINHASTTKINGTQFTGLKGSDNKYDNLTIFMIPQQLTSDAFVDIYLKKDDNTKDEHGKPYQNDKRADKKKIHIQLKENTIYKAGDVKKYRLSQKDEGDDLNLYFKLVRQNPVKNSDKILLTKGNNCTEGKNEKDEPKYQVKIESYRYAINNLPGCNKGNCKQVNPAIKAPQTFKVTKVEYSTFEGNSRIKKTYDPNDDNNKENAFIKCDIQQPDESNTVGFLNLTFYPDKYPMVKDRQSGTEVPQDRPLGSKEDDFIYIYLTQDGFPKPGLKLKCSSLPKPIAKLPK